MEVLPQSTHHLDLPVRAASISSGLMPFQCLRWMAVMSGIGFLVLPVPQFERVDESVLVSWQVGDSFLLVFAVGSEPYHDCLCAWRFVVTVRVYSAGCERGKLQRCFVVDGFGRFEVDDCPVPVVLDDEVGGACISFVEHGLFCVYHVEVLSYVVHPCLCCRLVCDCFSVQFWLVCPGDGCFEPFVD